MNWSKSFRAHRLRVKVSVVLLAISVASAGCRKEKPAESEMSPAAPPAAPPAASSPAPSGVFVHKDIATSSGGHDVDFYSILRFGKDGQVCSVNVSTELDDEALARYSKSCDAREKDREYGKYTYVNGTITFSLGESDYSGVFDKRQADLEHPLSAHSEDEHR